MNVWKRCFCALLACILIMSSSVNVSLAAGSLDGETNIWAASAADIVAEHYGLDPKVEAVLGSGAIRAGAEYETAAPHNNGTAEKTDLLAVDYRNKVLYVESYTTAEGYIWLPVEATLLAEGEVQETFALTEELTYYNNREYYASQAFAYQGNSYTIQVAYELALRIDTAEQQRILEIPAHLGQAIKNIESNLNRMWFNLQTFGEMIPSLYAMLSMELPVEPAVDGAPTTEPFFDTEEHAAEIAAIQELYAEYMENAAAPQLKMFTICDESLNSEENGLAFAMENGAEIQQISAALYDKLVVLEDSTRFRAVYNKLSTVAPELHTDLKNFYRYVSGFVGTATREGTVEVLKNPENWTILDPEVQARIFKEDYTKQDFETLEAVCYALRNVTYTVPTVKEEQLTAARVEVSTQITTYQVRAAVDAQVVREGVGVTELMELGGHYAIITLLEGTSAQEIEQAILQEGVEKSALQRWNEQNSRYQINSGNYTRTQSGLPDRLEGDVECSIAYAPNVYTVKTDYAGKMDVPYGYQLEFPGSNEEDGWYDYDVISADGSKSSYNQGLVYTVTDNIEVFRTAGAAKTEYRLLNYLAEDGQYQFSEEAKKILSSQAIDSPILKIRVPDADVSEIMEMEGGFYIEAPDYPSGMMGMVWKPVSGQLVKNGSAVQEITFSNGKASWTTADFTHVNVIYSLEVTRVKDGFGSRPLKDQEINEYVNLPHILVEEVSAQNQLLGGTSGVTGRTIYQKMKEYESFMGLLPNIYELMETDAGKNAVLRMQGSENEKVTGINGEALGCGGWSSTGNEAAIYKYLKLHANTNWSVAAYYQMGHYSKLSEQAGLMADCLEAIMNDPGLTDLLVTFDMLDKKDEVIELGPELRELSAGMKGPNKILNINHSQFTILIEEILQAKGKTSAYPEATTMVAYSTVVRNGANSGSLQLKVQVGNSEKMETFSYELETVDGSKRYHEFTLTEAENLKKNIANYKAALGLAPEKEKFYDFSGTEVPEAGAHLGRNEIVSLIYTPKTYTVTINGVPASEYKATFQYGGNYVIELPAKSDKTNAKTYYRYTMLDENGAVLDVCAVENGTTDSFAFTEEQLLTLFPSGGYVIYREELRVSGVPNLTLKPKLSTELIRGAEMDRGNHIMFLDVAPTGITVNQLLDEKNMTIEAENAVLTRLEVQDAQGNVLAGTRLVPNGAAIQYSLENVFGKEITESYSVILMGDVNGDGLCNEQDILLITPIYFMERDKKGNYVDEEGNIIDPPLTQQAMLAANMNNNKKIDSHDAWKIRSKGLYWNADGKQNQIVYRSVLN